jgi:radical SAM superfamily enzyme YgiQ (UPF0313 family)
MIFVNPYARVNFSLPNFNLVYAATHFNTRIIDLNTKPHPRQRFLNQKTDVIGISIQSRTYSEAMRISEEYKKKYPTAKIASVNTDIDIQCCYPFLKLKENVEFKPLFSDAYPFPRYDLLDSFTIFSKNWSSGKWDYPILTSVGCPFQCVYCAARNRKWRARSAKNCYEELKQAKEKFGIKKFEIVDDVFNLNKQRVLDFCKFVKKLNLKWSCVNGLRADLFDEEMAEAMSDSGCNIVGFGIESRDKDVLRGIQKGESIEQVEKAVDISKKYFKIVNGFFIIGLPGSTYEKDLQSLKWARSKRINAHFSYYVPAEKQISTSAVFYGEGAKPVGQEYDKRLQEKIYRATAYMRPEKSLIRRGINKIKRAWFAHRSFRID